MLRESLAANRTTAAAGLSATWFALSLLVLPMAARAGAAQASRCSREWPSRSARRSRRDSISCGGAAAKLLYGLTPYLDATAGVSFIGLPRAANSPSSGTATAWGYGGGLRLKRPHDAESLYGMSPWVDADALYIRTGPLNRFGFAAATGLALPIGKARNFWLGPDECATSRFRRAGRRSRRWPRREGAPAGLSFEFGTSPMRSGEAAHQAAEVPEAAVAVAAPVPESDWDNDGTIDRDDLCPDVVGPVSNHGCPVYEKVVVKPDKLELKEKIYFAWNSSPGSTEASHPGPRRGREGAEGQQELPRRGSRGTPPRKARMSTTRRSPSSARQAVLDYLVGHGIVQGPARLQGLQLIRADRHQRHGRRPREQPPRRIRRPFHHLDCREWQMNHLKTGFLFLLVSALSACGAADGRLRCQP